MDDCLAGIGAYEMTRPVNDKTARAKQSMMTNSYFDACLLIVLAYGSQTKYAHQQAAKQ